MCRYSYTPTVTILNRALFILAEATYSAATVMASAATKTGFLPKAKAMANNAIFRKALRATRIVVLGVGAYKIGSVPHLMTHVTAN